jgi:hypothetical protein
MSLNLYPTIPTARRFFSQASVLGAAMLSLVLLTSAGCEDNAIGRSCDVSSDAGLMQVVFNGQALECPTRLCIKPSTATGVASNPHTAAYCTAECSKDSDCDGESRDKKNPRDFRCTSGFTCGIAFEVGPLCCKKVCVCKDFVPKTGLVSPASCDKNRGASTCQNL